jgi:hypothetical protein
MPAYGDLNPAVAGLIQSRAPKVASGIAQESMTPGLPVFGYTGSGEKVWKLKADVSKLVVDADLSASNSTVVTVNSVAAAAVVYATSHAATMAALVNAIKALAGVEAVLDTTDANSRTILIRTKGATSTASAATTGGTGRTWTPTNGLFGQVFKGVLSSGSAMVPTTTGGSGSYAQYEAVPVVTAADIWVQAAAGVDSNEKAFVDVSTGAFAASGQDVGARCKISRNSDGVALVAIDDSGLAPLTYADRF